MAQQHLETMRAIKVHRPFKPFLFVTTDGERLAVQDRFQFAVNEAGTRIMYAFHDTDRLVEFGDDQVAAVEQPEAEPASQGMMLKPLRDFLRPMPSSPMRTVLQSGQRHDVHDPEKSCDRGNAGRPRIAYDGSADGVSWLIYSPRLRR